MFTGKGEEALRNGFDAAEAHLEEVYPMYHWRVLTEDEPEIVARWYKLHWTNFQKERYIGVRTPNHYTAAEIKDILIRQVVMKIESEE